MTNLKLSRYVCGAVFAIWALIVVIGVAVAGPKVGDTGGVMVLCTDPVVLEKIFRGGSDEVAITLFNEARENGTCSALPYPVYGEVTKIITSFVDHAGHLITIVEIEGDLYSFTAEETTDA